MQTDSELQRRVRSALECRKLLVNGQVAITADGGTVTLSGSARSYYDRQLMVHCCLRVPGVRNVVDEICVSTQKVSRRK